MALNSIINTNNCGTVPVSTIVATENGNGYDHITTLTLTNFIVGGMAGAAASGITTATAGVLNGIALNAAGSVKNVFLNSAGTWNANNTGNLTATGTIVLRWTNLS